MKVRDLIGINPEAEIVIVDKFGTPFEGELSYGWDADVDCEPGIDTKSSANEVHIFLIDTLETMKEKHKNILFKNK